MTVINDEIRSWARSIIKEGPFATGSKIAYNADIDKAVTVEDLLTKLPFLSTYQPSIFVITPIAVAVAITQAANSISAQSNSTILISPLANAAATYTLGTKISQVSSEVNFSSINWASVINQIPGNAISTNQISSLDASKLNWNNGGSGSIPISSLGTGSLPAGVIVAASQVSGGISAAQISSVNAGVVQGWGSVANGAIPGSAIDLSTATTIIPASKLGNGLVAAQISSVNANSIQGWGNLANGSIPGSAVDLSSAATIIPISSLGAGSLPAGAIVAASQVSSGLVAAQISSVNASAVQGWGSVANGAIPGSAVDLSSAATIIPASKVSSGLVAAQISSVNANSIQGWGNLANGVIPASAVVGGGAAINASAILNWSSLTNGTIPGNKINLTTANNGTLPLTSLGQGSLPLLISVSPTQILSGTLQPGVLMKTAGAVDASAINWNNIGTVATYGVPAADIKAWSGIASNSIPGSGVNLTGVTFPAPQIGNGLVSAQLALAKFATSASTYTPAHGACSGGVKTTDLPVTYISNAQLSFPQLMQIVSFCGLCGAIGHESATDGSLGCLSNFVVFI